MTRNGEKLQDLVSAILLRLPVKSLMRFKCVEKSWCHLIQDPSFVSKHYVSFNEMNLKYDDHFLVAGKYAFNPYENYTVQEQDLCFLSMISFDQTTNIMSSPNFLDLNDLQDTNFHGLHFQGPCNGIYFVQTKSFYMLINPSMREFKVIPFPEITDSIIVPSFGFDAKANEFKVVVICFNRAEGITHYLSRRAAVYHLNYDSEGWRDVLSPVPKYMHLHSYEAPFLHGSCHWLVGSEEIIIIGFDMVDQVFREIRLPNNDIHRNNVEMFKFKECASVISCPLGEQNPPYIKVWVMEEYGNEESWTNYFTIGPVVGVQKPLGFLRNNEIVLVDIDGVVALCDPYTLDIQDLGLQARSLALAMYKESLVSFRGDDLQNHARVYSFAIAPHQGFEMRLRPQRESNLWFRFRNGKKMHY